MSDQATHLPDPQPPDDLQHFLHWVNWNAEDPEVVGAAADLCALFDAGPFGPDLPYSVLFEDGQEAMELRVAENTYLGMMCATLIHLVATVRPELDRLLAAYQCAQARKREGAS